MTFRGMLRVCAGADEVGKSLEVTWQGAGWGLGSGLSPLCTIRVVGWTLALALGCFNGDKGREAESSDLAVGYSCSTKVGVTPGDSIQGHRGCHLWTVR